MSDGKSLSAIATMALEAEVTDAVRTIYDPEIPVNIYDLGLIYEVKVETSGAVNVKMTLTAPSCPEATFIPVRVESAIKAVPGVTDAKVDVVWDPPWSQERMSEAAKLQLGLI